MVSFYYKGRKKISFYRIGVCFRNVDTVVITWQKLLFVGCISHDVRIRRIFYRTATAMRFRAIRYVSILAAAGFGVLMIPMMLPIFAPAKLAAYYAKTGAAKTGLLKWADLKDHPLPQDFSDMLGWKEMAQKMSKVYRMLNKEEQENTVLFCDNYGQAAAVNFYGKQHHLPKSYSDNASFLNWIPDSRSATMQDFIILSDDRNEKQFPYLKNCRTWQSDYFNERRE